MSVSLLLLAVCAGSCLAQETALPDAEGAADLYKRLYDFGLGKRAYTYVSEYKRLPVYNFGLGKRAGRYEFGLGKRADQRLYSFGLGKRNDEYDDDFLQGLEDDYDYANEDLSDDAGDVDKRAGHQYSFGLGKRVRPYSFGLGKRGNGRMYEFGLGKRREHMYSFGLGKRSDGRLYSFGLGKRPNFAERQAGSRFNFGLGKRAWNDIEDEELAPAAPAEEKRAAPRELRRFDFGLGKREVAESELDAVKTETSDHKDKTDGGHHAVKRSLQYAFGLGKKDVEDAKAVEADDFDRYARRQYGFGLGKRVPMYDFGIGKRSEQ